MPNFIKWLKDNAKENRPVDIGVTSDFARSPYSSLYPHDYKLPDKLNELRSDLDQHTKDLCDKGSVDAGNYNALDNFITSGISSCAEDINYQSAERQRIINRLLNRWQGDLIDGQMKVDDFRKELDEVESELAQIKSSLKSSTGSTQTKPFPHEADRPEDDKSLEVITDAS